MEGEREARTHVRIDDTVLIKFRKVSLEEFQKKIEAYNSGKESPWIDPLRAPGEARKLNYHLKKLWEKNRDLAEVLEILATKLDRILLNLNKEALKDFKEVRVNISGAGIRLEMDPLPEVGDIFELDIGLLPDYYFFRVYAEVVRVEDGQAAMKFVWIKEEDLDKLVQNIFKKQLLQIQLSKRAVKDF